MSSVNPTQASATATKASSLTTPDTNVVNPGSVLGKNDFLKLLSSQLQYQDPLSPMDDSSMMGQMAQFSALEQTTNMAQSLDQLSTQTQFSQGVSLIGRNVQWADDSSQTSGTGQVSSVSVADGKVMVAIDGQSLPASDVTEVD